MSMKWMGCRNYILQHVHLKCTYVMIETPHPLHTHGRSSSYIYNAFQNLLLWLQVIRIQPHTCNGKSQGKDYVYDVLVLVCESYLSPNQHSGMTEEGTDHFRLDLTSVLYM